MSQRRMFSPDIVNSDAFLDMPVSSQALYFHLGMNADDDGFVNPKRVMRLMGASEDDLKVLISKRFLLPFQSGVVVIKHWLIHNLIRADLYKETLYKNEKKLLGLNENGAYTEMRDGVAELRLIKAPKWLKARKKNLRTANVPQSARRIGKDRIGKVSKNPMPNGIKGGKQNSMQYHEPIIELDENGDELEPQSKFKLPRGYTAKLAHYYMVKFNVPEVPGIFFGYRKTIEAMIMLSRTIHGDNLENIGEEIKARIDIAYKYSQKKEWGKIKLSTILENWNIILDEWSKEIEV